MFHMRRIKRPWLLAAIILFSVGAAFIVWRMWRPNRARNKFATVVSGKPQLVAQTGHSQAPTSIVFSPDGKLLASGSDDHTIKLWDVATGTEIRTLKKHIGGVKSVVFSPDGKMLASSSSDKTVKLWDIATGTEIRTLTGHSSWVDSVAFGLDGKMLISKSSSLHEIKLWDVDSGKEIPPQRNSKPMALSPQGKVLATANWHYDRIFDNWQDIKLWDVTTGTEIRTFKKHSGSVESAIFSPDGKTLASEDSAGTITLWNVTTGTEIGSLERTLESVAFSPDGKVLASVGRDHTIWLWDVATGAELRTLEGYLESVTFTPNGKTMACKDWASPNIKLYDVATGKEIRKLEGYSMPIAFSPDGKTLASRKWGDIKLVDISTGQEIHTLTGYAAKVGSVAFSPDGKTLASAAKILKLWDVATGKELSTPATTFDVNTFAFSPDSSLLAVADVLWDVTTGAEIHTLKRNGLISSISSLVFSPDGKMLVSDEASYGAIGYTVLWDVASGQELKRFANDANTKCSSGFNHNNGVVVIWCNTILYELGGKDTLELFDSIGNKLPSPTVNMRINSATFSPDGKTLAVGGRGIKLWSVATNLETRSLASEAAIESLAFSPDSKTIASGNGDYTIKLWDIATGEERPAFTGHTGSVSSVAFSPDGRTLVSGSEDGTIKLWDITKSVEMASIVILRNGDWVMFTPDGRFDTNRIDNIKGLHWLMPDAPLTPLPIEIFMRDYYEPKLLSRVLAREKFKPVRDFSTLNRTQPEVKITDIQPDSAETVQVTVEVANVKSEAQTSKLGFALESGVYDVRLFRDGQLVGYAPANDGKVALSFFGGKATLKFPNIKWPRTGVEQVEFSAYAFNSDGIKSTTDRKTYKLTPLPAQVKGRAYIISLGVNAYEREGLDLRYAANDARQVQESLSGRLAAQGEYEEVVSVPLVSDYAVALADGRTLAAQDATVQEERAGQKHGTENRATKGHLRAVLDVLAGRPADVALRKEIPHADRLRPARPEDLIIISVSSHGYTDSNGIFYIVPADTGTAAVSSPEFRSHCISSDELSRWLRDVDAGELVMIVDACHSAAAVEGSDFKPGPMGSRGLGQLSYDKGMRILTATQADNVAMETNRVRQGLLTYALLNDGLGEWRADYKPHDNQITLTEWLGYGVERVPHLYEEVKAGALQVSDTAANLNGVALIIRDIVDPRESDNAKAQQPSLFDFARKRRDVELARKP